MKVEVIKHDEENKDWKYPCLLEAKDGDVILATGENGDGEIEGTLVRSLDGILTFGVHDEEWDKDVFHLFTGKLVLSN